MKHRKSLHNQNYVSSHSTLLSGKKSADPESVETTPDAVYPSMTLTQPQQAQIKESFNYYHAIKNQLGQNKKKQGAPNRSLTRAKQGLGSFIAQESPMSSPRQP